MRWGQPWGLPWGATAPEVVITSAATGSTSYTLTGTVTGDDVASVTYQVNGGAQVALPAVAGDFTASLTLRVGLNTIAVRATNTSEEEGIAVLAITVSAATETTAGGALLAALPKALRLGGVG